MEVYVLDSLLRRQNVVEKFESLIWTERFAEVGDFELVIHSTRASRSLFLEGTRLAVNVSHRVMTVETVEDGTDSEGRKVLEVKGRSLEAIMEDRIAKSTHADLSTEPFWTLGGTPGGIAREIFHEICVVGRLSVYDIIPFMMPGNIFPPDSIPESETPIVAQIPVGTVKESIQNLCTLYDMGYRLIRNYDTSQLYFNIYTGNDRTTRQTLLPPVIFALDNDNLQNTKKLGTITGTKNVAYVYSEFGAVVVPGDNVPLDVNGFERRVLLVEANDIKEDTPDIPAALFQRGKEELSKARAMSAFDGELNQNSVYKYGVDYGLGDLVEMRDEDGEVTYKRVTEQIFVHDEQGERSYPTLTQNEFLNTETWLTQRDRVWSDYGATEYWADQ